MKRIVVVLILTLAVAGYASAQVTSPYDGGDELGAHNVYGRGCVACHAPHSGAAGNGVPSSANSGDLALWGQDLSPFYGQSLTFGGGRYTVSIPNYGTAFTGTPPTGFQQNGLPKSASDGTFVIAACLSCHDGNAASVGMMTGTAVETVTINKSIFRPPTLLGNQGQAKFNYNNDHPVGPQANVGCNGMYTWDCTINADGSISFNGTASSAFLTNYFDVTATGPISALVQVPGTYTPSFGGGLSSNSWVTCTTCHNQHAMQYFNTGNNKLGTNGYVPTAFFVRGWYAPGNSTSSNSAAQFCRSCHGGNSNEMSGAMSVPTH